MLWALVMLIVFASLFLTIFGSIFTVNWFRERERRDLQRFKREDEIAAKANRELMLFQVERLMELGIGDDNLKQLLSGTASEEKAEKVVRRARVHNGEIV